MLNVKNFVPGVFTALSLLGFLLGCTNDSSSNHTSPGGGGSATLTGPVNVTGSLVLSTDASTEAKDSNASVQEKPLTVVDESGNKLAEGKTDAQGVFQIQIDPNTLGLADTMPSNKVVTPKLLKLSSLFLMDAKDKEKAVGLQQSFLLDPNRVTKDSKGNQVLETGEQTARKVGAIVGQVTFETGGDASGIDVYIPGTTHIAKTDKDGKFLIGFLPAGTYNLRTQADGYMTQEWSDVAVGKNETTALEPVALPIATGPQVISFETESINIVTGQAKVKIKLARATKYRVSRLSDFSDTLFKPVEFGKNEFTVEVSLSAGVKEAKIYLEAADSDGLSALSTMTIDREPPSEGTIALAQNKILTNASNVPIALSALGATKMRFSETASDLTNASWIDYSTSSIYPLQNTSDGAKKIYASFADNAGNILGSAGEIFVNFTLDRTAPDDGKVNLLAPESPTGAFNTPLAWSSELTEPGISYQLQVSASASFSTILRDMTTTATILNIDPPLSSPGLYHWRVRAIDASGNSSGWTESSIANGKYFRVQVLATAFHANKEFKGIASQDHYFAKELVSLGDITNDGIADYAYTVPISNYNGNNGSCLECGLVRVVNGSTRAVLAEFSDVKDKHSLFGHRILPCDMNGDGRDDIVVTAPGTAVQVAGVSYYNAGAVYVYNGQTLALMASKEVGLTAPSSPPATGWNSYSCSVWNGDSTSCLAYGWKSYPYSTEYLPWGDGRFFGWSASCEHSASGPDHLWVGEPKYHNGTDGAVGRAQAFTYAAGNLTATDEVTGTAGDVDRMLAGSVQYLNRFKFGSCSTANPTLALGVPRALQSGMEMGAVYLYQLSGGGTWTYCDKIEAETGDATNSYYGQFLSNLGNIDKDGSQNEELAVSNSSWSGGIVRIYGGTSGTRLKSLRVSTGNFNRIGYKVLAAGDFTGDGQSEILITAPDSQVNGQWGAGAAFLYRWSDLDDGLGDAASSPLLTVTGIPSSNAQLGVAALPIYSTLGDSHSSASSLMLSSPGRNIDGDWSVGSFQQYSSLKLAPGLPSSHIGLSTNARMGFNLAPVGDVDNDNVPDLIVAQPGGRCDGKPWGMISLFSVLDQKITKDLCATSYMDYLGTGLFSFSGSNTLLFSKRASEGFYLFLSDFLSLRDLNSFYPGSTTSYFSSRTFSLDWSTPTFVTDSESNSWGSRYIVSKPNSDNYSPYVAKVGAISIMDSSSNAPLCTIYGNTENSLFGYWASFLPDIYPAGAPDGRKEILIGEAGITAGSSKGRIYILDGSIPCTGGASIILTTASPYVLGYVDANDSIFTAAIGGDAQSGFGSFVLALPDLDGNLGSSPPPSDTYYFFVGNSNMKAGTSSVTSQYLVMSYNVSVNAFAVLKSETGSASGQLGGYARVIDDINGDGVKELAISYPGGSGRFGATGNVRIFSGYGLSTTNDSSDDLLQALFSPDPSSSNFGVSFEYVDMNADGLKDFVVGADLYDSPSFPNAGAVYVFPMRPIKE